MLTNPNMNRRERRAAEALDRHRKKKLSDMPPARADGRPLYFDINDQDWVLCYECAKKGLVSRYKKGEAVLNDPANPPKDQPKGDVFTICVHHIPDNAVIYNPRTNMCRNKSGDHTWEEGAREDIPDDLFK